MTAAGSKETSSLSDLEATAKSPSAHHCQRSKIPDFGSVHLINHTFAPDVTDELESGTLLQGILENVTARLRAL